MLEAKLRSGECIGLGLFEFQKGCYAPVSSTEMQPYQPLVHNFVRTLHAFTVLIIGPYTAIGL